MIGYKDKTSSLSGYQPSQEVCELTKIVKEDYSRGVDILNRPWVELNDRSIIEDENRGQTMFNAFVDTSSDNPSDAWKWRGTRSMARNKGIAMHANLTANYLLPLFMAQNEDDELDRDFSEVMRDIIEWMASPSNSNYQSSFLQIVFGMLTNPITYMGAEFIEVYQTIKTKSASGKYTKKEILDEVLSGFQAPIYSSSQVLITNAYERNIQKQRSIIKRRYAEKSELEAKYGDHDNWVFVQEGIRSLYNDEDGLFYDIKDDEHLTIVAEETYLNRREDTEVCFINGIYFGESKVEDNPIKHRNQKDAPMYNVVPFGYYRIGEHFFYYKSMMNALGWDNDYYDAMTEVVMNRALLEVDMPIAITGSEKIDSELIFPNAVIAFENAETKISPILPSSNMVAGFNALQATEQSISEGSVSDTMSGQLPEASQKAYTVAQAQSNARKMISSVAKSLAESVMQYGLLMKDIALNNITAPQVDELTSGKLKLKYKTFLVDKGGASGMKTNRRIKFDKDLIGKEMSEEEEEYENIGLAQESGYPENKDSIIKVNPEMFARFNYLCRVDTEEMFAKNQEYWQQILPNLYSMLANNPFADMEWLTRKIMYAYFQSEGEEGIKKQPQGLPQGMPEQGGMPGMPQPKMMSPTPNVPQVL